jgi:hypothetical protein
MTANNRAQFRLVLENQKTILDGLMAILLVSYNATEARKMAKASERTQEWLDADEELYR